MGQGHIHDWDPGIAPNGLFWTVRVPPESVHVDLNAVKASWRLTDFALPDELTDLIGSVTMNMQWGGEATPASIDDPDNGFAGTYSECKGTIEWTASEPGFTFVSAPASTTTTRFAALGRERNGIFYNMVGPKPFFTRRLGDL